MHLKFCVRGYHIPTFLRVFLFALSGDATKVVCPLYSMTSMHGYTQSNDFWCLNRFVNMPTHISVKMTLATKSQTQTHTHTHTHTYSYTYAHTQTYANRQTKAQRPSDRDWGRREQVQQGRWDLVSFRPNRLRLETLQRVALDCRWPLKPWKQLFDIDSFWGFKFTELRVFRQLPPAAVQTHLNKIMFSQELRLKCYRSFSFLNSKYYRFS